MLRTWLWTKCYRLVLINLCSNEIIRINLHKIISIWLGYPKSVLSIKKHYFFRCGTGTLLHKGSGSRFSYLVKVEPNLLWTRFFEYIPTRVSISFSIFKAYVRKNNKLRGGIVFFMVFSRIFFRDIVENTLLCHIQTSAIGLNMAWWKRRCSSYLMIETSEIKKQNFFC